MLEKLKADGRKLVTIIDPHTKVDEGYWLYRDSQELRLNVGDADRKQDF
jgi:alpha-glucosidase (family GH31 glycosyl hydrolase)